MLQYYIVICQTITNNYCKINIHNSQSIVKIIGFKKLLLLFEKIKELSKIEQENKYKRNYYPQNWFVCLIFLLLFQ